MRRRGARKKRYGAAYSAEKGESVGAILSDFAGSTTLPAAISKQAADLNLVGYERLKKGEEEGQNISSPAAPDWARRASVEGGKGQREIVLKRTSWVIKKAGPVGGRFSFGATERGKETRSG